MPTSAQIRIFDSSSGKRLASQNSFASKQAKAPIENGLFAMMPETVQQPPACGVRATWSRSGTCG